VQVEGRIGPQARWLTANKNAFVNLPWNRDDLKSIVNMWDTVIETPNVVGGYFTSRHVSNAWNRVVIGGMDPRTSLELCVKDINKEIDRKREQLGYPVYQK